MSIMAIALRRFEEAFGGAYDESDPQDVVALAEIIEQETRAREQRVIEIINAQTARLREEARNG